MLLKKFATVSIGVLLSLKAMAGYKELYSVDLAQIESNKKKLSDEHYSYKICTNYRTNEYFAFDATAIGNQKTAIFGSKIAPCKLQSLLDLPQSDAYLFSAMLELPPKSLT
ncbi:hypothetical protein [Pseudomonas sp. C2B4]|uniref:hypothetical protein n=1 Tax=Pseudomonas sp. C2B4 TaxID=2735270 RepID=UPI001586006A|nr:hypothetical protein [Pseudomonas sp. C2B4]NUU36889.1 hypothetical protein [Pseudomonas sp. C2B4]